MYLTESTSLSGDQRAKLIACSSDEWLRFYYTKQDFCLPNVRLLINSEIVMVKYNDPSKGPRTTLTQSQLNADSGSSPLLFLWLIAVIDFLLLHWTTEAKKQEKKNNHTITQSSIWHCVLCKLGLTFRNPDKQSNCSEQPSRCTAIWDTAQAKLFCVTHTVSD